MIDRVQRLLYKFCDKDPIQFWGYTPAETTLMLDVKIKDHEQQIKDEVMIHADIKCWLLNSAISPYLKKGERFPYKTEEFLPKDMRPKKPVISEAEKSKRWAAAGAAMMKVVREHERETGVKA